MEQPVLLQLRVTVPADRTDRVVELFEGCPGTSLLAAVAIVSDSAILVIGAMVLGPELAPLAGLAVALVHGRRRNARNAAVTLLVGFVVAIGSTTAPDRRSVVVAVLAGIAGVLSLTSADLAGILVSATATLALQKAVRHRMPRVVPPMERLHPARARG